MPLGSAPILYTLYKNHLIANPHDPNWINRDRFVLSAGHASALLYAMLHVTGFDLSIDELKAFRQIDSLTPDIRNIATPKVLKLRPVRWDKASPRPSASLSPNRRSSPACRRPQTH
jgi:transketolase N-terminal domain/subunit